MNTILVQPSFPNKALLKPSEIKDHLIDIRDTSKIPNMYFPDLNMIPMPEGVMHFEWGDVKCPFLALSVLT